MASIPPTTPSTSAASSSMRAWSDGAAERLVQQALVVGAGGHDIGAPLSGALLRGRPPAGARHLGPVRRKSVRHDLSAGPGRDLAAQSPPVRNEWRARPGRQRHLAVPACRGSAAKTAGYALFR